MLAATGFIILLIGAFLSIMLLLDSEDKVAFVTAIICSIISIAFFSAHYITYPKHAYIKYNTAPCVNITKSCTPNPFGDDVCTVTKVTVLCDKGVIKEEQ